MVGNSLAPNPTYRKGGAGAWGAAGRLQIKRRNGSLSRNPARKAEGGYVKTDGT